MKRIKIFPAPHMELRVFVSDEMVEDYKKCEEAARQIGEEKTATHAVGISPYSEKFVCASLKKWKVFLLRRSHERKKTV